LSTIDLQGRNAILNPGEPIGSGQTQFAERGRVMIRSGLPEAAKDDRPYAARRRGQFRRNRSNRNLRGAIGWKPVNSGRDGREGDRRKPMSCGEI
jgi:hypothetical protein